MAVLYLASGSPRRRELLSQIGVPHVSLAVSIDERVAPGEPPAAYVERLACGKAAAGLAALAGAAVVLGADTAVVLDGRILGKPRDRGHALDMLRALSGREHQVLTAVAVSDRRRCECRVVTSSVRLRSLDEAQLQAYWETGEPWDKAGGYAIQGLGAVFVEHLCGSYSAVVGLPLCETAQLLAGFAIPCWQRLDETR